MGFMDSISGAVNRGTASVGRSTRQLQIKSRINELVKERQGLAAQLGASLYDVVRNDPALMSGREPIVGGMGRIDAEIEQLRAEQRALEAQAAAGESIKCPFCGSSLHAGDAFCSGCGASIDKINEALNRSAVPTTGAAIPEGMIACAGCGAPVSPDDAFCMSCGTRVEKSAPAQAEAAPAVTETVVEVVEEAPAPAAAIDPDACPFCGAPFGSEDLFCGACGKSRDEIMAARG